MDGKATSKPLRVASYNIRKARGLDQRRDPVRILNVINALGADVVALQEADKRLGARPGALCRDLIAKETDFEVAPLARNDVSLGWHGNAILLRKGLQAASVSHLDLPGVEPRGAVRIDLDGPYRLSIIGTHLGLLRRSRLRQMRIIRDDLADATHAVIAGDFNEWSVSRGLEPLHAYNVHAPGHSFHARRPVAALDRIAMSRSLTLHAAGVEQGALARRASDHLPIWADIIPA
jgi:endonuclease/exonuclease/phosphatase family metal-dependent hydrolase